ncbi:MAG: hypothetical protein PHG48_05905 [Eubacteriales bacterium]|nr:hypothetical protein [Eubacteriales bacterium]
MARISFMLADEDEKYINSLYYYIKDKYAGVLHVRILKREQEKGGGSEITNETGIAAQSGGILLTGKSRWEKIRDSRFPAYVVILGDRDGEDLYEGNPCVFRYQPAGKIIDQCFDLYRGRFTMRNKVCKKTDRNGEENAEIVAAEGAADGMAREGSSFYSTVGNRSADSTVRTVASARETAIVSALSPSGGSGRTLILYTCAGILGEAGFRTLFISLENIPTLEFYTGDCGKGYGFSEVILGMKKKDRNIPLLIDRYSEQVTEHLDVIHSAECPYDLNEFNAAEIRELLWGIRQSCGYDFVLIDNDHSLSPANVAILEASSMIFNIFGGAASEKFRHEKMMKHLRMAGEDKFARICGRMITIQNKCAKESWPEELSEFGEGTAAYILPFDKEILMEGGEGSCHGIDTGCRMAMMLKHILEECGIDMSEVTRTQEEQSCSVGEGDI